MPIRPIFVFSITRSGSTLVQRVIAAHDGVATTSEPWLLLPYLYTLRDSGVVAEYTHRLMATAVEDFCRELPDGQKDYLRELHDFILRLYEKAAKGEARYFLDKSPPYYFVAREIMELFPEGKFVFLWRNPLSIVASIIETWHRGKWHATTHREDLFIGLPRLVEAYRENEASVHSIRFEDLVDGDEAHWTRLMDYLEIEFDRQALQQFSRVRLKGRMGDPTGVNEYASLSAEPTRKWTQTLANPLRREWCRRYLHYLGNERLAVMGYDGDRLVEELRSQPFSTDALVGDVGRLINDVAREPIRARNRRNGIGGPGSVLTELLRA